MDDIVRIDQPQVLQVSGIPSKTQSAVRKWRTSIAGSHQDLKIDLTERDEIFWGFPSMSGLEKVS